MAQVTVDYSSILNDEPHLESGTKTVNVAYNSWQYYTINFEKPFETIPLVTYDYNGGASACIIFVSEITVNNFKIGFNQKWDTAARSCTVNWYAQENFDGKKNLYT